MELKKYIIEEIKYIVNTLSFVKSGTIVGSFESAQDFKHISDIDIVIIVDTLTKNKFEEIIEKFKVFGNQVQVYYGYDILINTTFGPLKFNKDNNIVFHIMIYDVEGHINHCITSPFTCLDWQNSTLFFKKPLSSIYSVKILQPNDIFDARRGIKDYLLDFRANKISYREYQFIGQSYHEIKKYIDLNTKQAFEFAYHIIKYTMLNFLKLYYQKNILLSRHNIIKEYISIFPKNKEKHQEFFLKIKKLKDSNSFCEWTTSNEQSIVTFLDDFQTQFKKLFYSTSLRLIFMRHSKTSLNLSGTFIGQRTDVDIVSIDKRIIQEFLRKLGNFDMYIAYTSPSKRCYNTLMILKENGLNTDCIRININLKEIDYGAIEGKDIEYLKKNYPEIINAWNEKLDIRFPNGENTNDVLQRINVFISDLKTELLDDKFNSQCLICTHNVVLRCLIGSLYNLPVHLFYLIDVPHLDPIEVLIPTNGNIYINLTQEQKKEFFKKLNNEKI